MLCPGEVLGVQCDAGAQTVKSAQRTLCLDRHLCFIVCIMIADENMVCGVQSGKYGW